MTVVRGSRDEIPHAFSLHFCTLEAIKNWRCGRPENEVTLSQLQCQEALMKSLAGCKSDHVHLMLSGPPLFQCA